MAEPLTEEQLLAMLEDPNEALPLYGATPEASQGRLGRLRELSDFVGRYDPNVNLTDEYTPDVMSAYGGDLSRYVSAQEAYNRALESQKAFEGAPMTQFERTGSGYTSNEYAMEAGNIAAGVPPGKYTIAQAQAIAKGLAGGMSKSQAENYINAYNQTYNYWQNTAPAERSRLSTELDASRRGAVENFVAPSGMYELEKNRLGRSLEGIRANAVQSANQDIFKQAWAAKRGATEQTNRLGFLSGGGRRSANQGIERTAFGAASGVEEASRSEVQDKMARFNQAMEDARLSTSNLEADIKNRGFGALAETATGNQITDFGRALSSTRKSQIEGAQEELSRKLRKEQLFGDVASMIGGGFGRTALGLVED